MPHRSPLEEPPWWWRRCTHTQYPVMNWRVLREAEQLAILLPMAGHRVNLVHILVDVAQVDSICKQLDYRAYTKFEEPELLGIICSMRDELRSL